MNEYSFKCTHRAVRIKSRPTKQRAAASQWSLNFPPSVPLSVHVSNRDGPPWVVHKLGGTSLQTAERFVRAADFLTEAHDGTLQCIVVSAMAGITDTLVSLARHAETTGGAPGLEPLADRLLSTLEALLPAAARPGHYEAVDRDLRALSDLLGTVAKLRALEPTLLALVSGYGEYWSQRFLAAHLNARGRRVAALDARKVLFTADGGILRAESERAFRTLWAQHPEAESVVVTGFVASTREGRPTTLGRNGSDYSATLFGQLLSARAVTIWTDVPGVLTADPRRVPGARTVSSLSYKEAMELAYFGAKVLHPRTMHPVMHAAIPVWIRSALDPAAPGTRIGSESPTATVKAISNIDKLALVELSGGAMLGVPGVARRLFAQLEGGGVSVVLISQGSSEHTICFAVAEAEAERAASLVNEAFYPEIDRGTLEKARITRSCSVLALVGDGMAGRAGLAAQALTALGRAGANVWAIAQGASERNLSVVVDSRDATRALRAVHAGFWLSRPSLSIVVLGAGVVGGALLDQLVRTRPELRDARQVDLRIRGISGRRRMVLFEPELDDTRGWRTQLEGGSDASLEGLIAHLLADGAPHGVIVDATADEALPNRYAGWLASGLHVVTANKRAGSGDLERWDRIRGAAEGKGTRWRYETTVGAGLPVLTSIRDLVETGDVVHRVEGLLSGSVSWMFDRAQGADRPPWSDVAREARRRGLTEPDLRDDLSGMDVARKLVILAREAGLRLRLEDVEVESLVSSEVAETRLDAVCDALAHEDDAMAARVDRASARGEVLRYAASLEGNRAEVRVRSYPLEHPFAGARGTDNVVQVTSARYCERPLLVQGPGAGPEVTAGGMYAELLRLAQNLGR